jgi:hypothetical protein
MNYAVCGLVATLLSLPSAFAADPSLRVDYAGFTVWLNCQGHAVFKFRYNAQRDAGAFRALLPSVSIRQSPTPASPPIPIVSSPLRPEH